MWTALMEWKTCMSQWTLLGQIMWYVRVPTWDCNTPEFIHSCRFYECRRWQRSHLTTVHMSTLSNINATVRGGMMNSSDSLGKHKNISLLWNILLIEFTEHVWDVTLSGWYLFYSNIINATVWVKYITPGYLNVNTLVDLEYTGTFITMDAFVLYPYK